jgi:hypothetical protein
MGKGQCKFIYLATIIYKSDTGHALMHPFPTIEKGKMALRIVNESHLFF